MSIFVSSVHYDLENGAIYDERVHREMNDTINNIQKSRQPMTNIEYPLNYVMHMVFRNHGDRRSGMDLIIILTDGQVRHLTKTSQ